MTLSHQEAALLNPLQLAFIGDAVYALRIRLKAVSSGQGMRAVHRLTTAYVCAASQAKALAAIMGGLTEPELEQVKRGRNAHAHHPAPRSATSAEYAASTGFETLIGYLYLTGQSERIDELIARVETLMNAQESDHA